MYWPGCAKLIWHCFCIAMMMLSLSLYAQVLDFFFFLSTYSSNMWAKVKQSLPEPNQIAGSTQEICICNYNDPGQFSGHEGKVPAQLLSIQLNCFLIPKTGTLVWAVTDEQPLTGDTSWKLLLFTKLLLLFHFLRFYFILFHVFHFFIGITFKGSCQPSRAQMTGDKSVNGWLSYKTILACYKSKGHIWKKNKSKRKKADDYVVLNRDYKLGLLKQES